MAWEPRDGTKVAVLLAAMEAQRASRPIWSQTDAAQAMDVPRSMVPQYIAAACNAERLYRRTLANGSGIELSLERFPAHAPAPLPIPTFGKAAAAAASAAVRGFVPPKMTAPRPGSDHHLPKTAPGGPPAPSGIRVSLPPAPTGPEAAAADAAAVASVPAQGLDDMPHCAADAGKPREGCRVARCGDADVCWAPPAPAVTVVNNTGTPAAVREEAGTDDGRVLVVEPESPADEEERVEEEATEPDAFLSARTGEYILVGLEPDEEGRITIPADLVNLMRRQLAWSAAR